MAGDQSDAVSNAIAATGEAWLTEFAGRGDDAGARMGGSIIAPDLASAEAAADRRGLGETVIGQLAGTGKL